MPAVVDTIASHRPAQLGGRSLVEAMPIAERSPANLRGCYERWQANVAGWRTASPTLAFAVISQARADGKMSPEEEGRLLAELLAFWALRTTIDTSEACAMQPAVRRPYRARPIHSHALEIA